MRKQWQKIAEKNRTDGVIKCALEKNISILKASGIVEVYLKEFESLKRLHIICLKEIIEEGGSMEYLENLIEEMKKGE